MDGLYEQVRIALHQVWRRRWLALGVAWGVAVLGWLIIALIPSSYEAKARLFVQVQSILPAQVGIAPEDRQSQLMRLKQTLTSNENLVRVVRRTDLANLAATDRDMAGIVSALRERITITAMPDGMIEIIGSSNISGFSNGQNARTAAATVQGLVDLFIEQNLNGGDGREAGQSLQFLDEELRRRETALREAEQRRVEFEQQFMGLLPGEGSIGQRMSAARAELANIQQQIVAGQAGVGAMRTQLNSTPANLPGMGAVGSSASSQIAGLEGQIAQNLARGWTEQHPDIVAARDQIARLRPYAQSESRNGSVGASNPSYISLRAMLSEREAQLSAAMSRRNQLQSDLAQLSAREATGPGAAAEQDRVNRDYEVLKQQYDELLAQREQARLRTDVRTRTAPLAIQVVEPPRVPSVPAAPNRPIFLTAVLVLALGAGVAAAFVVGQLQTTFPTQGRLAAVTGLNVLGTVSEVVMPPERVRRRQRLAWFGGAGAALASCYALLILVEFWQRSTVA